MMVDEITRDLEAWRGESMRVHGWVVAGSIVRTTPETTTFTLTKSGAKLQVRHEGILPDTFRDQSEVVLFGSVEKDGDDWLFESSEMLTKCCSKYDGNCGRSSGKNLAKFE